MMRRNPLLVCAVAIVAATSAPTVAASVQWVSQQTPLPSAATTSARVSTVEPVPKAGPTTAPHADALAKGWLHRWLDIQAATFAIRYRRVDTTAGVVTANQLQHNEGLRVRLTFDAKGRYGIGIGVASGSSFTSGWNNAGVGTPHTFMADMALRQLYVTATPVKGVEAHVGGLFFVRGEGTEITGYDNDGYLTGTRVAIKRADWIGADEFDVTAGYLGDTTTPNILRRADRMSEINYWQVLIAKKQGRVGWSSDFTSAAHLRTLRGAMSVKVPAARVVDLVRGEAYHRFDGAASGFAMSAEKTLTKRVTFGAGLADIDLNYGGLNGDRYGKGQRWFATGNITLVSELSLLTFYQHTFGNDVALPNRSRLDVILQFNALKALQRAKVY